MVLKTIASTSRHRQFCPIPPPVRITRFEDRGFKDHSSAPISHPAEQQRSRLHCCKSFLFGHRLWPEMSIARFSFIILDKCHAFSLCSAMQARVEFSFPIIFAKSVPSHYLISALQKIQPPKKLQHPSRQRPVTITITIPILTPKNPPLLLPQPLPLLSLSLLPCLPCQVAVMPMPGTNIIITTTVVVGVIARS